MKNKLIILIIAVCFSLTSCLPDNFTFSYYAIEALQLVECQSDYLRPQTESFTYTNTYIVKNTDGEAVANAVVFRKFEVIECDGTIRAYNAGQIFTDANGRFTENQNFVSNYFNDRLLSKAELLEPIKIAEQSHRQRARDGGKTFTFIVKELED